MVLRQFAASLPAGQATARAGDLWAHIGREMQASGLGAGAAPERYLQRIAQRSGALFLLDGLDECGDAARRAAVQAAVRELIDTAPPACRFVLTARPYAWPQGPNAERGVYALAELTDEQIAQFIRAWYAVLQRRGWRNAADAERKCADLLAAHQRPELLPLARNPLLLTLMATLHSHRGGLPDDRVQLYDDSVNLLLQKWNQPVGADKALLDELAIPGLTLTHLRTVLEEVAYEAHLASQGDGAASAKHGKGDTADIGEDALVRAFKPLLNDSKDKADVVLDYIEKRAGLLVALGGLHDDKAPAAPSALVGKPGERRFTFVHRSFQEFLAACHLGERDDFEVECKALASAATAQHWELVLPLAARKAGGPRGASAADELIDGQSIAAAQSQRELAPSDWACALLAASMLLEVGRNAVCSRPRGREIAARVAGWLAAALPLHPADDDGLPARQRARAGDMLDALGDPRFGDAARGHLPTDAALGFVRIAALPAFCIGTRPQDRQRVEKAIGGKVRDGEMNDEPVATPEFYIARYAVTVAQFRHFVACSNHQLGDADALQGPGNRPVRWIDWHEAKAYCAWLTQQLRTNTLAGCLPPLPAQRTPRAGAAQWQVDLPSELEWEIAARGGLVGAAFPWGDAADAERANVHDTDADGVMAVGCFPANGHGLHDMVGNVWEWTRSLWENPSTGAEYGYPYHMDDVRREDANAADDVARLVRGGSWYDSSDYARCAYRFRFHPDDRYFNLGFRVVLRSSPV